MMKDLYIFIGNKLISTDTILPLRYVGEIYFITFHSTTYLDIKRNHTLFKALNKIGKILFLGNSYSLSIAQVPVKKNKIKSYLFKQKAKIYLLKYFFLLVTKVFFKKAIIFILIYLIYFLLIYFLKYLNLQYTKWIEFGRQTLCVKPLYLILLTFSNTQVLLVISFAFIRSLII